MHGTAIAETAQHRPIGRELEEPSRRSGTRHLHIDRFCYIGRQEHGSWGWQCSLCPLPLRLATFAAVSWRDAIDEATRHLRSAHADASDLHSNEERWAVAA